MRLGSVKKLTEEEIQDRLARYARYPDPQTKDEIVLQYANLVESIARRFVGACEPLEDLVQEGYIGLMDSLDKYDSAKGVKFSTYATHFIIGGIKHYLRDKGKMIKEPAWLQELNQKMTRVIESLNQKHGRQPTEKEIGEVMQMPESTVRDLLTTREVFKIGSLDGDRDESSGARDAEKITDQKVVMFQLPIEDKIVLETALDRLKDIEQQVIAEHFYKGLNQTEIARNLGISCNYVSHILRNGTRKLRKILTTDEIRDTQLQRALSARRVRSTEDSPAAVDGVLDSTTGLYNRRYFEERLHEEICRAYRHKHKLAVMLVEVCTPDEIEAYLRAVRTDDLLYMAGQCVRERVRKMDIVARYSDTCFGLILPHTSREAQVVADRLTQAVCAIQIESGRAGCKLGAVVRVGFAEYPAEASNSRDLIEAAARKLGMSAREQQADDARLDRAA